jgi:predicted nucleic acid-binding Zn ribbon protein
VTEFVRVGDVLRPALSRLSGTPQATAYAAWDAACGPQVAAVTRPQRFTRGTLWVECESAVWAQELTFLGAAILERMLAADADCPVLRLRFVAAAGAARRPDRRGATH